MSAASTITNYTLNIAEPQFDPMFQANAFALLLIMTVVMIVRQ